MRLTFLAASALGLALAVTLLAWYGLGPVLGAVAAAGWGAALVALVRAGETSAAGLAWWFILPGRARVSVGVCSLLRWLRESINCLLPVAQVGGEMVGARLLTFRGVDGGAAGASVVADLFVQTVTQFFYTLIGLACLIQAGGDTAIVRGAAIGLAVLGPALVGFFAAQRYGGFKLLDRALLRLARDPKWAAVGSTASLHARLQDIYRAPARLAASFTVHGAIWFLGVLETWIALRAMGHGVGYSQALVIDSLGHAVRGAAFVVPGAVGIQEGGMVALCAVFGVPAPVAIALSLVRRLPEIVFGLPGLLFWQETERRHLRRPVGTDIRQPAS